METLQMEREMPRYKSHKTVWALKIKAIDMVRDPDSMVIKGATITPVEEGYAPFSVDVKYLSKHDPKVGGYYVTYADGYKSWSPAQAFEEGYMPELGATGQFPEGKLNQSDEGELKFAVGKKDGQVFIAFGKPVAWMAMPPETAKQLAGLLTTHAQER